MRPLLYALGVAVLAWLVGGTLIALAISVVAVVFFGWNPGEDTYTAMVAIPTLALIVVGAVYGWRRGSKARTT